MVNITFPDTKPVIDAIRNAIGRNITFVLDTITNCTVCSLDPVTGGSTDPFCTTCGGKYYIVTDANHIVLAHVTNGRVDQLGWASGGQFEEGDCRAQLDYTTVNDGYVANARKIIVDGKEYRIKNKEYRGAPQINRIILYLRQED
jgi:hypothetical protein